MPLKILAVYQDGVLKPLQPLPLNEHEQVFLSIEKSTVLNTAGMVEWKGDFEELRRVAEGIEFSILESDNAEPSDHESGEPPLTE